MTPLVRLGRNTAGAAIAASVLVGGGATALADGQTNADAAPSTTPSTAPVSIEAADASAAKGYGDTSAAEIEVKAPVQRTETAPADTRDDADSHADAQDSSDDQRQDRSDRSEQRTDRDEQQRTDRQSRSEERNDRQSRTERRDRSDRSERRASQQRSHRSSDSQSSSKEQRSEAPRGSAKGSSIVATARNGIGTPYVFGGSSRGGWDCSGFTSWVYRQHGINLPHSASAQRNMGHRVSRAEARPGDLVYTPGHVGIYAGNGRIIDAGNSRRMTSERPLWSASWTFVRIG